MVCILWCLGYTADHMKMKLAAIVFVSGIALLGLTYIGAPEETSAASYCDSQGGCTGPSANDWYRPWAMPRDSGYRNYRDYVDYNRFIPNGRNYNYSGYEPYRYEYEYRYEDDDDRRYYDDEDDWYYDLRDRGYDCARKYRDSERLCKKYKYREYDDRYDNRDRDNDRDYRYYYEYRYSY